MLWKAIISQKGGVPIAEIQSVLELSWVVAGGVISKVARRDGMPHGLIFWDKHGELGVDITENTWKGKKLKT